MWLVRRYLVAVMRAPARSPQVCGTYVIHGKPKMTANAFTSMTIRRAV